MIPTGGFEWVTETFFHEEDAAPVEHPADLMAGKTFRRPDARRQGEKKHVILTAGQGKIVPGGAERRCQPMKTSGHG